MNVSCKPCHTAEAVCVPWKSVRLIQPARPRRALDLRTKPLASIPLTIAVLASLVGVGQALAQRPMGIDVSHWQGTGIDWVSVKNSGRTFAYCKASEGTGYTDATFTLNTGNARSAGVYIGGYHFARYDLNLGTNGAVAEANHYWSVAHNYIANGGYYLMPMLDVEHAPGASYNKTTLSQWVDTWCTTISNTAKASGVTVRPVIYTSSSFAGTWLNSTVTKWIPWIANWNGQNPQTGAPSPVSPWSTWNVWQYTDAASVPGAGTVDGDVFNGTAAGLVSLLLIGGIPPGITSQPVSLTVMAGSNVTFAVGATGATPLYYQWKFNGANISGATGSSYIRNNAQLPNAGSYSVSVTNSFGTTNSANAVLTVHAPPTISVQPTNLVTGLGMKAAFSVTASGSTPLSYQWRFNGNNLPGATTNSFTVANTWASNAGTYVIVITNLYGSVASTDAVLTMLDPYITNQPVSLRVAVGAPGSFAVGAVGTAPLSYSWQKDGVPLTDSANVTGSASAALNVASVQVGDVGTYSVVVSNANNDWVMSSNVTLTAAYAPSITTQPASQQVPAGSSVFLSVSVAGPGPMTCQWRKDGTNLVDGVFVSGSTNTTLSVSNFQVGAVGNYSVVVSNTNGTAASSNALITVWPLLAWGAGMTNANATPNYGQSVVPPNLSNIVAVAGGLYHSLGLRGDGTVAAWGAGWTNKGISPNWGQAIVPGGLSNAVDVSGGYYHSLALIGDGTVKAWGAGTTNAGANPQYGQAQVPDGLSNAVAVAAGGYHSLALRSDRTVLAWGAGTTSTGTSSDYGQAVVPDSVSNAVAVAAGGYHSLAVLADHTVVAWGAGTNNTGVSPYYGQAIVPADLSDVVMAAAGGYHSLALKADGTVVAWGDNTYGQTNAPISLSNVVGIAAGRYNSLALKSDGTVVGWGAGTNNTGSSPNLGQSAAPAWSANAIAVKSGGSHTLVIESDGSPTVTVQPLDQVAAAGGNVTYAVMAVGSQPLNYQWQLDGTNIPGATSAMLSLAGVQLSHVGAYSVTVSNGVGTVTSSNALLTVLSPPVISQQPGGQTVIVGAPALFTVEVAGTAPLTYQWQFNTVEIAGATDSSYSLTSSALTNAGTYVVMVSNAYGAVTSSNAVLAILTPPTITAQPSNQTVVAGADVSFSVVADSAAPLSYEWHLAETNHLVAVDAATLSLTNVQPDQAGEYWVVVNNIAGPVTSAVATLTVLIPANILTAPAYNTDGVFQVNLAGLAGSNYVVEGSTNLVDWSPLETNTSPFSFSDTNALNVPMQFYRAHLAP
jgi:GH25 family lysozyme M1 (1,4-beta-N-acetylmuramidase)/alpha-tubulin suppressor-like RCC1 family protein